MKYPPRHVNPHRPSLHPNPPAGSSHGRHCVSTAPPQPPGCDPSPHATAEQGSHVVPFRQNPSTHSNAHSSDDETNTAPLRSSHGTHMVSRVVLHARTRNPAPHCMLSEQTAHPSDLAYDPASHSNAQALVHRTEPVNEQFKHDASLVPPQPPAYIPGTHEGLPHGRHSVPLYQKPCMQTKSHPRVHIFK